MKIGAKVTVLFPGVSPAGHRFLRCYVIRRLSAGWQLYDPVRNYSWGLRDEEARARVVIR